MWTRCTSSSEKQKKLEVFETRINHFKSCKTSLFLPFPLLLRLICEPERQSFGELQKSHPNTSLAYFWQILSKLFPLFSLPTDHSKRSFWEEREKGASFVIMYSFCNMCHHRYHEILIIIKIFQNIDHDRDIFQVMEGHTLLRCLHAHVAGRPNRIIIITSARVKTSNILAASRGLLTICGPVESIALSKFLPVWILKSVKKLPSWSDNGETPSPSYEF